MVGRSNVRYWFIYYSRGVALGTYSLVASDKYCISSSVVAKVQASTTNQSQNLLSLNQSLSQS